MPREEYERRNELISRSGSIHYRVKTSPLYVDILKLVSSKLEEYPSKAAMHRDLAAAGLYSKSLDTFRKDVRGKSVWSVSKGVVSPYNLFAVAEWLEVKLDVRLESAVLELRKLSDLEKEPLPIIGPPLFKMPNGWWFPDE